MAWFRKKSSVVIEAREYTGRNGTALLAWMAGTPVEESPRHDFVEIRTLEGTMRANTGDWIIKGVQGEFYPIKADIFAATYEPADGIPT